MTNRKFPPERTHYLPKTGLGNLVDLIVGDGYLALGPTVVDQVVMFGPIRSAADLAKGIEDEQDGGCYRTRQGDPEMFFRYRVGPEGPKRYLFPPALRLFGLHVEKEGFAFEEEMSKPRKMAFVGIRSCEIAAIEIQDRVFGVGHRPEGAFRCEMDDYYKLARADCLVVAVNCTRTGGTCFCASMGTGPQATKGFDLSLTEQRGGFVLEAGSERGEELTRRLPVRAPSSAEVELAELHLELARQNMGRELETDQLPAILDRNIEHPRWDEVAQRCLGCGSCAYLCPTCFCSSMVDGSDLRQTHMDRRRLRDVCFTHQFSYTTSGPVRSSIRSRYRHWLRHKLGTWHEQFGGSGCVGCGRCITWCPVGIDITQEAAAIRASEATPPQDAGAEEGI